MMKEDVPSARSPLIILRIHIVNGLANWPICTVTERANAGQCILSSEQRQLINNLFFPNPMPHTQSICLFGPLV